MKPFTSKLFTALLFAFCIASFACRKDKPILQEEPATGSITGVIQPAAAVTKITATDTITGKSYIAVPDSSGRFTITPVLSGFYQLSFAFDSLYAPVNLPFNATVNKGETTDLGIEQFTRTDTIGSATIKGMGYPANAFGEVTITSADKKYQYKSIPDGTGFFIFQNVVPATYTLHFNITDAVLNPIKDSLITVVKNQVLELGNFYTTAKPGFTTGKIDTIVGNYLTERDLLSRAPYDSLIVIQGNILSIYRESNTPEMTSALQKIVSISGAFNYSDETVTAITMDKLTYVGNLTIFNAPNLTSVSFKNLKTIAGGLSIDETSQLTTINWPSLNELSGSLSLNATAFSNLNILAGVSFHPFMLELLNNLTLSDLTALKFGSDSVYNLTVWNNPLLTRLNGLQGIRLVKNKILITDNSALQTLEGMEHIVNADQLELTSNPQLTTICPAKTVINSVKDRPSYTVRKTDALGNWVTVTVYPYIASNNGSYATADDMKNAVEQCP